MEKKKRYWANLLINTNQTLKQLSNSTTDAELKYLLALGSSLHAVQDFYSHSNFKL